MAKFYNLPWPLIALAALSLLGCAAGIRLQENDTHPVAALRRRLDALLADSALARTTAGVKIVSLQTGEVLYERNAHLLFHPASNQKLLTAAAALKLLGPAFTFNTSLVCDSAALHESVIAGDLYLVGRGNPDLTTNDLLSLAHALAQRGIREIRGNLLCDDYYFDEVRWGAGWMWDDDYERFTALTVNDNLVRLTVSPAAKVGDVAQVEVVPNTPHTTIVNTSVTTASTAQSDSLRLPALAVTRRAANVLVVEGALARDAQPRTFTCTVVEPEIFAGQILRGLLQQLGIKCHGGVQRGLHPARAVTLAEHRAPLLPVLINLNKISDNLSAELMLKVVAAEVAGRPGTAEKGMQVIRRFLASAQVDTNALHLADGSGVSRYNLITPEEIVKLLSAMWRDFSVRNEFLATLPIAGVDGTLANRMKGTAAEGLLRAKTGSLTGVSSLSGYATTAEGEEIAFAMMMQHFLGSAGGVRRVQDRIAAEMCGLRRRGALPAK
ncbi:MAG: D-alanyl-D-alanine carboxypeptidase/D-alanyl-D-alanine-endopeptidase [candidate division KSB1 bacterium]|nr:D-alanyl-D-alanine carboxypeptidase/D-alanyl-D-alanine-endopeptidase [candidate division KSB1 bacterium]MDZ7274490.1 D-alanyl-D-alanine carboxypeptidase/D-alanyl-D-alanine-endopeptidase [candidate division KSB1 bacterium]MDZ7284848.1 D-alanyl-D-alanine carboxypeptidase/D-alanyl-D-alanine-endopeptidase [candidate division KSB1 bacterium]MDZ7297732.1 D-alanyl-D-alanine carboxypeptidase/D-alanyl-D-alanine-endopeptidase [candidate division KSB1 bacterium]MDZ7307593.1 D-alanyl-D-alanine carboxype